MLQRETNGASPLLDRAVPIRCAEGMADRPGDGSVTIDSVRIGDGGEAGAGQERARGRMMMFDLDVHGTLPARAFGVASRPSEVMLYATGYTVPA